MSQDSLLDTLDILRRSLMFTVGGGLVAIVLWAVIGGHVQAPAGDYETRQGDILLSDGKSAQARERFEAALAANPDHRGAMMGRAIALLQDGQPEAAETAFSDMIGFLERTLEPDDATGRGALAAAYANRGIVHDREGRIERALADYRRALAIDAEAVAGPGLVMRVLYGTPDPGTVALRVAYLEGQLRLPPGERVLHRPDIDARQRMHKP